MIKPITYPFAVLKGMSRMVDCREDKRDKLDKNLNSEHSSRKRRFETRLIAKAKVFKKAWPNTLFYYFNTKVVYLNFKVDKNKNNSR